MTKYLFSFAAVAILIFNLVSCGKSDGPDDESAETNYSPYHKIEDAKYVGAENCKSCHEKEFADWMESDHHKAMMAATDESVLGNFDDIEFDHFGAKTRFFKKGDEFWVNTEGPDGKLTDYKIDYTFGHFPLQQYLIPFPGGRYQALQVCWDSRPADEGGQRWFHLYQDEPIPADDILHWTRRHFNWNYMCADCHSTNLKKNFDVEKNEYNTTWSEMNVSCEACHGPASEHVKWAEAESQEIGDVDANAVLDYLKESKGLVVTLKEPEEGSWTINPETGQPERTVPLKSTVQVETCARCHAHRQLLASNFKAGQGFHDTHSPSVLSDQLYHHDGQIDEEVYVYGSFVQSKMYHAGVRCSDCHNPHSMKLVAQGNALCVQCHDGNKYLAETHHFHQIGSKGANCVECHMPTKNYMVVDPRRDHSLRVPRPDLAAKLGTPDACTNCHTDKDVKWATDAFVKWWGDEKRADHYGEIMASGRSGEPGSLTGLLALANDKTTPGIVRASALQSAANYHAPTPETLRTIQARLADSDPAVRKEAVAATLPFPPDQRLTVVGEMLTDSSRSVRAEAARVLAVAENLMTEEQRSDFEKAAAEFFEQQNAIADRAAGHLGLGLFHADKGDLAAAEKAYRTGIRIEPEFIPTRVNLAELLFGQNRLLDAEKEFRGAIEAALVDENRGMAHDALARFLVRLKRYDEALEELEKATELLPRHAQTHYFYGVALNSLGKFEEAQKPLRHAVKLDPSNVEYLVGVAAIFKDAGKLDEALEFAAKAFALQPDNPGIRGLMGELQSRAR